MVPRVPRWARRRAGRQTTSEAATAERADELESSTAPCDGAGARRAPHRQTLHACTDAVQRDGSALCILHACHNLPTRVVAIPVDRSPRTRARDRDGERIRFGLSARSTSRSRGTDRRRIETSRPATPLPDDVRDLRSMLWSSIDNRESRDLDQVEFCEARRRRARRDCDSASPTSTDLVPKGSAIDRAPQRTRRRCTRASRRSRCCPRSCRPI